MEQKQFLITSSQTWVVPKDWSNVNKIEVVGGGGSGGQGRILIREAGGGRTIDYALGGSGGGYASVNNLNVLSPEQTVIITIGAGGGAGLDLGSPGGTTNFGGYILGSGASIVNYDHFGGTGSTTLSVGSYGSFISRSGQNRLLTGQQLVNIPAGTSGASGSGGSITGYGGGGRGQKLGGGAWPADSGVRGAVFITYTPSGTHQACVWIS